jgi:hypothetical protein
MASRGLHEFTVQEADNFEAFGDWYYEEIDLRTAYAWTTVANISSLNIAKQVTLYIKPGVGAADTADALSLYINDTISDSTSLANEAMDNSETDFTVDDEADFTAGDVILVNSELMYVSAVTSDSSHVLTVTRGYGNSAAVAHDNNSIIYKVGTPANHTASTSKTPIIRLDVNNLPFKISGVSINKLSIHNAGADSGDADDYVSVLSFY